MAATDQIPGQEYEYVEPSSAATGISQAGLSGCALFSERELFSHQSIRFGFCATSGIVCGVAGDLTSRSPVGDTCRCLSFFPFSEGNDIGQLAGLMRDDGLIHCFLALVTKPFRLIMASATICLPVLLQG